MKHISAQLKNPTPTREVRIGDPLASLTQGIHTSRRSGSYLGNGEYKIKMDDGGNGPDFVMHFRLIAHGGKRFTLDRLDAGDPDTTLHDAGNGVLTGGEFTLNFR